MSLALAFAGLMLLWPATGHATTVASVCDTEVDTGQHQCLNFATGKDVSRTFGFLGYLMRFTFDTVLQDFGLRLFASEEDPAAVNERIHVNFPNQDCVPFTIPSADTQSLCVDFQVESPRPVKDEDFRGLFHIRISWDIDPDPFNMNTFALHARGDSLIPEEDITTGYNPLPGDPTIDGETDHFSDFLVSRAPIPEPGTMVLLGTGIVAALASRRRQKR